MVMRDPGLALMLLIGVIILPILMSLGVPKPLAVTSYLMSVGSGMYINQVLRCSSFVSS